MGWLAGYSYRKKGSVNATAAGAQTNYQKQLLVGESSGAAGEDVLGVRRRPGAPTLPGRYVAQGGRLRHRAQRRLRPAAIRRLELT